MVSPSPVAPLQMLGGNGDCVELSGEDGDDDDDDDEFEDSEPIETTATETGSRLHPLAGVGGRHEGSCERRPHWQTPSPGPATYSF